MLMLWSKPTWLGTRKAATKPSLQARWRILHRGHSPRHADQRISQEPGRTYALLRDVEHPYCKGMRVYGSPWNKTQPVGAGSGVVYTDLDHLSGAWSEKDFSEFHKKIADFETVDKKMWK